MNTFISPFEKPLEVSTNAHKITGDYFNRMQRTLNLYARAEVLFSYSYLHRRFGKNPFLLENIIPNILRKYEKNFPLRIFWEMS